MIVEPAQRDEFLALLQETYGVAMPVIRQNAGREDKAEVLPGGVYDPAATRDADTTLAWFSGSAARLLVSHDLARASGPGAPLCVMLL